MSHDPGRNGQDAAAPPNAVREGVREGILAALEREDRRTGGWAARRLAAAGAAGVAGAVALTILFAGGSSTQDHAWHLALCGAAWAGLLVESFAFVLLRIQTPRLPLRQAAALGLVGVALAALVGVFCPEPHYLGWWDSTRLGAHAHGFAGASGSALCFGFCSSLFLGMSAALVLSWRGGRPAGSALPALALWLLLFPAVVLQTLAASLGVLVAWSVGTAAGAYLGVASGRALTS